MIAKNRTSRESRPRQPKRARQKSILLHHKSQVFKHFGVLMTNKHLFIRLKNPCNPCNPRLMKYSLCFCTFSLTSYGIRSTKDYVRKNNLFMQNKAKFRKVKFNVTEVLTKDYDQLDTWLNRKTKPIQSQLKPIQSQLKPILCQNKANSNPNKPNSCPPSGWRNRGK